MKVQYIMCKNDMYTKLTIKLPDESNHQLPKMPKGNPELEFKR